MKKINYLLLFACSPFLIQPAQASENFVFNDTASFTLAKAVKLGRSSTALGNTSSELRDQLGGLNGGNQSNACLTGYYNSGVNGCQACSDAMTGCLECESSAACKKCDISKKYELINNSCKLGVCSWNHNNPVVLATQCSSIDGYGRTSSITVPDTNPKYGTVNIRFWDNATVSGGAFTATNLKSTGHTSWELGNLDSVITFNNPVTVTGTVVLQEDSSDAAQGVKMVFNAGLKGNPKCVVEKQVASSGCSSASCSKTVDTNNTCTCTSSECFIDQPAAVACNGSNKFFWNANGSMTIPSGYACIDGYGANSSITMPSGTPAYSSVNIRFWDYASVSGSFTTSELSSLSHTASRLSDLDPVITFKNPVTVNGTVKLAEASGSTSGNRKGVKMVFSGGLNGNPSCVVVKQVPSSGCGYASCQSTVETDAVCVCSSSECVIKDDGCEGTFSWNSDGSKTVPAGYCNVWGYGAYSTITMPSGAVFDSVSLPFWDKATVNGSFTTSKLSSTGHTDTQLSNLDTVITFNDTVTVNGTVTLQEASSGGKGVTMKFLKGLKGSPSCKVEKRVPSTGCSSVSCSKAVNTSTTCSCSGSECKIN